MDRDGTHPPLDVADVRALVESFQGPLIRYAHRLVRDEDRAQDIVQEVFLQYLQSPPHAREARQVSSWLFRVTHNRAVDLIRKESRMRESTQAMPAPSPAPPASEAMIREETSRRLDGLIGQLTENQRACLVLKFQEGKSYREISEITGLSVTNVGFLLHQAVKKMGRLLVQEEAV